MSKYGGSLNMTYYEYGGYDLTQSKKNLKTTIETLMYHEIEMHELKLYLKQPSEIYYMLVKSCYDITSIQILLPNQDITYRGK